MRFALVVLLASSSLLSIGACRGGKGEPAPAGDPVASAPEVTPPFAVREGEEGLYAVWYDAEGTAHTASSLSEVPAEQRARVRVDSLRVAPDQRLDPAFVYVADLRAKNAAGVYGVRKVARDAFEASVLPKPAAEPSVGEAVASAGKDIVLYGASWCGACKQARNYFAQKGVPFIEKDIEKEPDARTEMLAKARAQGVSTNGIPVIDVRGTLMGGFDPQRIERVLAN